MTTSNCTTETGHLPGSDHRWQECPTYHDDEQETHLFFNVNEEGLPYDVHGTLDEALNVLAEFPNDTVIVVVHGSPAHRSLAAEMMSSEP